MSTPRFKVGDLVSAWSEWGHMWKEDLVEHRRAEVDRGMLVISAEPVYDRDGDEQVQNLRVLFNGEEWLISSTNVTLIEENGDA